MVNGDGDWYGIMGGEGCLRNFTKTSLEVDICDMCLILRLNLHAYLARL